ncbi:ATP-binding protein [Streptomyces sp. HUAS TT20]|uniref:ATP-binding protein n=1 Tax=Streptomyces sp. HUAS TT20 TaxID=3447509 RepID=UPI002954E0DA|nr:ATP-binding protein [Streptomyces sp. HUAS 15-9]
MTRTILRAHGLTDVTDAAVQVTSELVACACRFAPAADVHVSLRYREDALRVVLYDGHPRHTHPRHTHPRHTHPRHTHPRLATACDARRRAALRVLGCVVRACDGDWGFGDAREPGGGTRIGAVLPREGACAYLRRG